MLNNKHFERSQKLLKQDEDLKVRQTSLFIIHLKHCIDSKHVHGLRRIIRRRSFPRNIAKYNSPTQVRDHLVEL